jgi:hypothetical protein
MDPLATAFPEAGERYDWRIYPLAPPAKCDLLHTYDDSEVVTIPSDARPARRRGHAGLFPRYGV